MAQNSQNLRIPLGRYFSANSSEGPKDRIISSITTSDGKVALPGAAVVLEITPKMRLTVVGKNLDGYNRAEILGNDGKVRVVYPKTIHEETIHEGLFTFVGFDVPNYGDEKFGFSLRLQSNSPAIDSFTIDQQFFNYRDETEEEKQDREKKEAAAKEAQDKAEAAQRQDSDEQAAKNFETKETAGLKAVGEIGTIAAGAAIAAGTAATAVADGVAGVSAPVHKWQGDDNEQTAPTGQVSKRTNFTNPIPESSVTIAAGQPAVITKTEPKAASAPSTFGSAAPSVAPAGPSQPLGAKETEQPAAVNSAAAPNFFLRRQPQPQPQPVPSARFSGPPQPVSATASAVQSVPSAGGQAQTTNVRQANQEVSGAASTKAAGSTSSSEAASVSASGSASSKASSETTVQASGTAQMSANASLQAKQSAAISAEVKAKQSATLEQASKAGITIAEEVREVGSLARSEPQSTSTKIAASAQTPDQPKPSGKPTVNQPLKNRPTLKLEQEYDAKFTAFQKNARDLDVKLKRPRGLAEPLGGAAVLPQIRRETESSSVLPVPGGQTEKIVQGSTVAEKGELPEQEQPISAQVNRELPQALPRSPLQLPVEPVVAAPVPAAEVAQGGAAPGTVPAAPQRPSSAVKAKAATLAADAIAGPEAGIVISFLKKHWKLVLGLLAAGLLVFIGLAMVFLLTVTSAACNNWFVGGLAYMSGYQNVCAAVKNIGTAGANGTTLGTTNGTLNTNPGSGTCTPVVSGPASVANLQTTCFGGNAQQASSIAGAESGGDPTRLSATDKCADGNPVSVGLFQINLTNHQIAGLNCPSAFSSQYTGSNHTCIVTNQALYQSCVTAAQDPNNNIAAACIISKNGASWSQWGSNTKCGF